MLYVEELTNKKIQIMGSIVRVAAYTAMTVVGLLGLKKEGIIELDIKKILDILK